MKNGFTLIELLAVIVVLAIIALIATPIVLSIIEDAKESATLRSAEFYLNRVEYAIANKSMTLGGAYRPSECIIQEDGNLLCDSKDTLIVEVKGEKPTGGTIIFEEGKIVDVELTLGNKTVVKNNKGQLVLGESINESICTLVSGKAKAIGSKYQCKVKDDMEEGFEDGYYFFVLSHNDDRTTNLIMERNMYYDSDNDIGIVATEQNPGLVAWNSSANTHSYGPVTALTYLHNATKDWNNVPNMIMNYKDENIDYETQKKGTNGYGSIVTTGITTVITGKNEEETGRIENLKARMPRYDEVHGTGKCLTTKENGGKYGSCPLWLSNYLKNSYVTEDGIQIISGIYGYWTLSSMADYSDHAWDVDSYGRVSSYEVYYTSLDDVRDGVRPVINLKL